MDVSGNLESHDLAVGNGSIELNRETNSPHEDNSVAKLTAERSLGNQVAESSYTEINPIMNDNDDSDVEEEQPDLVSEMRNYEVKEPSTLSLGDKVSKVSADSPEIDSESNKMPETDTDLPDISAGNNDAEFSCNLPDKDSENKLEISSDLTKADMESKEPEVSVELEINSEVNNKLEIASDLPDVDAEKRNTPEMFVERPRLSSPVNIVVEQFSALTENPPESKTFQRRRSEDISLVAYESSASDSEPDCTEPVKLTPVLNGVNNHGSPQELESSEKSHEEKIGDYDEMEDSFDKEGALQIDESQFDEERSLISPEIERGNDADELSSIDKSQESSKGLHLEASSDSDSDDERGSEMRKKPSTGRIVEKGGKASVKLEDHGSLESGEKQRKDQEDEAPSTEAKKPEVKSKSAARHRSQRVSFSSGSSCPCCVESPKPSHTSGTKVTPFSGTKVTPTTGNGTKVTPTTGSGTKVTPTSGTKVNPTPATTIKATPAVMETPPSTSKARGPRIMSPKETNLPVADDHPLAQPFHIGWRRELVVRASAEPGRKRQADVYYFPPTGSKLRSLPEVLKYAGEHADQGLAVHNFSFVREAIFRPPQETERSAFQRPQKTTATPPGSSGKKRGKPAVQSNQDNKSVEKDMATPKMEDYSKRQRKPKFLPDYVVSAPSPLSSSSSCEKWAENTAVRRKSVEMKEDPVVISRSGRRIKARNLEIVEQMQVLKAEELLSREFKTPKAEQEAAIISPASLKTEVQPFTPKNMNLESPGTKVNLAPFGGKLKTILTSKMKNIEPSSPLIKSTDLAGTKMKILGPTGSKMKNLEPAATKMKMEPSSPLIKNIDLAGTKMKNLEPTGPKMKNLEPSGPKMKNLEPSGKKTKKLTPIAPKPNNSSPGSEIKKEESSSQKVKTIESSGPKMKNLDSPSPKTKNLEPLAPKTKSLKSKNQESAVTKSTKNLESLGTKSTKHLETSGTKSTHKVESTKSLESGGTKSTHKVESTKSVASSGTKSTHKVESMKNLESAGAKSTHKVESTKSIESSGTKLTHKVEATKSLNSSGAKSANKVEPSGPKMKNLDSPPPKIKHVESSGPKVKNLDQSGSKPKHLEPSGPRMRNLHSSPNRKQPEVAKKDTIEEPMSPERPRRNVAKRKYEEFPTGIFEDSDDDEGPPVPTPKKTPPSPTPNKIAKIITVDLTKQKDVHKGKENAPNSAIEQLFGESLASVKSPKINFTFSKFTKRLNPATVDKAHGAPNKKKLKTDKSCSVNDRLCSLSCPGRKCSLPTLHCDVCLCLFHPECMGFFKGAPKNFTCSWCKKEPASIDTNVATEEEKKTESLKNSVQPDVLKNGIANTDELEDDIASDDDVEFLPVAPEVVFSQQLNHNVPVVPGIAFMRKPPPLTRAPVPQTSAPTQIRPTKTILKPPVPTLLVSAANNAQAHLLPPYGVASSTLRTIANLAQGSPQQLAGLVSSGPTTFLLPNGLPSGPRPTTPGTASAIQVPVPGVTKGTVIYTNNPNLRFILTPSITTTTTIGSPSLPVLPSQAPVANEVITVTSTPGVLVTTSSKEPAASTSKTMSTPGVLLTATAKEPAPAPSTSKAASPTVVKEVSPPKVQEPPPPPPRPPTPPPPPDPEPIIIDMRETSLCDAMLKIKIPEPGSGLKKAKVILKKPESRERAQIPKPKKRGRVKGSTLKRNEDGRAVIVPPTADSPGVPKDITICHDVPETEKTSSGEAIDDTNIAETSESKDVTMTDESASPKLPSDETTKTQETYDKVTDSTNRIDDVSAEKEPVKTPDTAEKEQVKTTDMAEKEPVKTTDTAEKDPVKTPDMEQKEPTNNVPDSRAPTDSLDDRPFSPLPSFFTDELDIMNSDAESIESEDEAPAVPVILREVKHSKSVRFVTTCLSNRGAMLTSPSSNCARTLGFVRARRDAIWSEEHAYSFSPTQPCLSSTRKTVMTLNMPERPFHSLQSACDSLHLVFEYLSAQDLIRAGQVCRTWRKLATQAHLWRSVKLKGVCIIDWISCAKMLERVKTTYLDLRGMKCKEHMWHQFVGSLHHLRNIKELVFGEVPNFVLTVVACSLIQLQCLEAENIYTDVKSLPYWDPGCVSSLQKLSILRMRAPKGVELPRFLPYAGFSSFSQLSYLTHMSLTSFRNCKSAYFDFLEKMPQLEVLEIGSCQDWDEEAYRRLVKLKSLTRLRLELGGTAADRGLANALTYLSRLDDLTLISFKITSSLAAAIRRLRNLWHLTLWPDMSSEGGLIVYNTLQAVRSLKKLQSFSWGVIYEDNSTIKFSRHTSKYQESNEVDEWWSDELRKTPHARGIRVPLLKAFAEGSKQKESKNEMQQGLIGVGHLHHKLKRVLPDTDVYLYQVPESLLTKVYGTLR